MAAAAAAALDSSGSDGETNQQDGWRDWGVEGDQAIAVGVGEALKHAADSVYDEMEEEIVAAAGRGEEPTNSMIHSSTEYKPDTLDYSRALNRRPGAVVRHRTT